MSIKPKKSRSKKMQPTHPQANANPVAAGDANAPAPVVNQPIAQPPVPMPLDGAHVMALPPVIGGQWQLATIVGNPNPADPNGPIVQLADGTRYYFKDVQTSAAVAPTSVMDPQSPIGYAANIGTLDTLQPRYATFRDNIVDLYSVAQAMFQMPLQTVVTMAYNLAYTQQLNATGKMDVIGNQSIFVPDNPTFERWMTAYLEEVQRREASANGPEA